MSSKKKVSSSTEQEHINRPSFLQLTKALSDPTRLKILSILFKGPKSLDMITRELNLSKDKKSNVKGHLEELMKPSLIFQVERYGEYLLLAPKLIIDLLKSLNGICNMHTEIYRSLKEASLMYRNIIIAYSEEEKRKMKPAFEAEFDKIFKSNVFSQIEPHLRSLYISMALKGEYDFSRLRDLT